ncbi:MAG: glycoside hydrolase family 88 protein, partial [Propionibacteriaceae bacterium]|nr:glycoside hydrolase family 88 protein [Propionibacteriaceae bacterium]
MTGSRAVLSAALDRAAATIGANAAAFGPLFPDDCAVDGVYRPRPPGAGQPTGGNHGWTTGFRTGLLWLAFQRAAQPDLRQAAQRDVASFSRRIDQRIDTDTHDLGFLYSLSCVTAWQLAGDAAARRAGLRAADALLERVIEPAGVIQAWGALSDPGQRGRTIIDSLMNTPLLWWASAVSGRRRYAAAAWRHTAQLRDHIIRPDNTTFHTFWWRTDDGRPLGGTTEQGFSDGSCWARGQAWGIYGFALNHALSGDPSFLRAARRCSDHYLDRLPADGVPYWDLVFADGCDQPKDTSAAAIAACGLAELAARVGPDQEGRRYRRAAEATA